MADGGRIVGYVMSDILITPLDDFDA